MVLASAFVPPEPTDEMKNGEADIYLQEVELQDWAFPSTAVNLCEGCSVAEATNLATSAFRLQMAAGKTVCFTPLETAKDRHEELASLYIG